MKWFRQLYSRHRRYDDLSISIQEHLEEKVEELMEDGMSRQDATRTARREFGNVTLVEERSREVWQWLRLESIWADVKFALRKLRRSPGFTIVCVLTIALGIGANTTIFTVVYATLLAPLPYPHSDRLVWIESTTKTGHREVSTGDFTDWKQQTHAFQDLSARTGGSFNIAGAGQPENILGMHVTPNYYRMLGSGLFLGRDFLPDEARGMESTLFGVGAIDFAVWGAVAIVLLMAALLASFLPARLAASIDPMQALRAE